MSYEHGSRLPEAEVDVDKLKLELENQGYSLFLIPEGFVRPKNLMDSLPKGLKLEEAGSQIRVKSEGDPIEARGDDISLVYDPNRVDIAKYTTLNQTLIKPRILGTNAPL